MEEWLVIEVWKVISNYTLNELKQSLEINKNLELENKKLELENKKLELEINDIKNKLSEAKALVTEEVATTDLLIEELKKCKALIIAQQYALTQKTVQVKPIQVTKCDGTYAGGTKNCTYLPRWKVNTEHFCYRCARIKANMPRNAYLDSSFIIRGFNKM